jgi:hypothetical protein
MNPMHTKRAQQVNAILADLLYMSFAHTTAEKELEYAEMVAGALPAPRKTQCAQLIQRIKRVDPVGDSDGAMRLGRDIIHFVSAPSHPAPSM